MPASPITPDIWEGSHFVHKDCGVLLLGESWPGQTTPLSLYIPAWLSGAGVDTTYRQITNGFLASKIAKKRHSTAASIWDGLAFMNFIPGSVGPTIMTRPNVKMYSAAAVLLNILLPSLTPRGCIIVGYEQSDYSRPVIEAAQIPYIVVPHPRSAVVKEIYAFSWDCMNRIKK